MSSFGKRSTPSQDELLMALIDTDMMGGHVSPVKKPAKATTPDFDDTQEIITMQLSLGEGPYHIIQNIPSLNKR